MTEEKDFSFEVNGVTITSNTLYQVTPKYDADAPQGFKDYGTSKVLMRGITESAPCVFDESKGTWDTGFYENSNCYLGKSSTEKANMVRILEQHIVKPFEETVGVGGLRATQDNNKFWDGWGTVDKNGTPFGQLYNGKVFNTADVKSLLELYIAILHNHVVLEEQTSAPHARKAKYCIINKEASTSLKEQRLLLKSEAVGSYYVLLNSDKENLLSVLEYMQLISSRDTDSRTLNTLLMQFLEDPKVGHENVKRFLDVIKKTKSTKGIKELKIFSALKVLFSKGVVTKNYGEYYLNDFLLGNRLSEGASKALSNSGLADEIFEELENLENKKVKVVAKKVEIEEKATQEEDPIKKELETLRKEKEEAQKEIAKLKAEKEATPTPKKPVVKKAVADKNK